MSTAEIILFWLFAALTCGGAVSVCVSQNVVRMAFALVLTTQPLGESQASFQRLSNAIVGSFS